MMSEWLPQAELLQHPAVVTGVCHGGNGGLQDFVTAGKPAVGFPHFGDQGPHVSLWVDTGACISLIDPDALSKRAKFDEEHEKYTHYTPHFSEHHAFEAFRKMLVDNKYTDAAMKLKVSARAQGGARLAVQTIERALLNYTAGELVSRNGKDMMEASHMVDLDYYSHSGKSSLVECCCLLLVLVPALVLYLLLGGFKGFLNVT